jgi:superfamily I DNA/RNA helicase
LLTLAGLYYRTAQAIAESRNQPFSAIIVDEAQDVSIPQLRLLAALGGNRRNSLFFADDLGQRIFQQPFSWKELGIEVRGRSTRLKINYRTSHQIRKQADRLLGPGVSDVDGNTEERKDTISIAAATCRANVDEHPVLLKAPRRYRTCEGGQPPSDGMPADTFPPVSFPSATPFTA